MIPASEYMQMTERIEKLEKALDKATPKKYPYPLTIVFDRYNGVYSGGKFTAWNKSFDEVPIEIEEDDVTCREFWNKHEESNGIVGLGETPEEAVNDLIARLERETFER